MKKLLFILFLTIPFVGFGQGWEMFFGGPGRQHGGSIQETNDGGYIYCGYGGGIHLVKTDSLGNIQWYQTHGTNSERGYDVKQTNDGGYIISGSTYLTSYNSYIIKTDVNGNLQWDQTYSNFIESWGTSIEQTNDGGYIISGKSWDNINFQYNMMLIKTNSLGNQQWTQIFQGKDGSDVKQTNDGGYIITGQSVNQDMYLIKTDMNGILEWDQSFGGTNPEVGRSVYETNDNGYIICGTKSWDDDVFLVRTDSIGDTLWTKSYGGSGVDLGSSVKQTNDGGYIICGTYNGYFDDGVLLGGDIWIIKTNSTGDTSWTKTFDGSNSLFRDIGSSVQQTIDGGYIICGTSEVSFPDDFEIYIIKLDSQGNTTSTFNIPTLSSNRKLEKVVDILGRETKPQHNTPFIEIYDDGSTEKKLVVD